MTWFNDAWIDASRALPQQLLPSCKVFYLLPRSDHSANAITGLSAFALQGNLLPSTLPLISLRRQRRGVEQGEQCRRELEQLPRTLGFRMLRASNRRGSRKKEAEVGAFCRLQFVSYSFGLVNTTSKRPCLIIRSMVYYCLLHLLRTQNFPLTL